MILGRAHNRELEHAVLAKTNMMDWTSLRCPCRLPTSCPLASGSFFLSSQAKDSLGSLTFPQDLTHCVPSREWPEGWYDLCFLLREPS